MSSKRYYDESYKYHDNWCNFLVEQGLGPDEMAQAQAQAAAEAERAEQEELALQSTGAQLAQFASMVKKLGVESPNEAKASLNAVFGEFNDLITQEDDVMTFINDLSDDIGLTGTRLQRSMNEQEINNGSN